MPATSNTGVLIVNVCSLVLTVQESQHVRYAKSFIGAHTAIVVMG